MPRVIRHPELRRAEILDAAFKIFLERGYDNTSLNEVIELAGLSKGMFYHHFQSKEALLLALFETVTEQTYQALEPILNEAGIDQKSRLQKILDKGAEIRLSNVDVTRSVFGALLRPESKMLYQGIIDAWADRMRPVLAVIIAEGVNEGTFDTFDAEGVGDLILQMGAATKYILDEAMAAQTRRRRDAAAAVLEKRLRFHALTIGRMLGLPDDTFSIGQPDFAKKLVRALNPLK
ncbi:MAG: TetR/AcrR family transcriptional regulator [Mesorhizobium sp.]|uniref:TetR/AcrR family transcriptional regulator n=1 Tax=Mesorhizobium sp. TaxID=1871066 RepID=UPI0012009C55|nr:TetR/AcrR family transcriptional regulator [Mesorhizobium sp.]TIR15849.1 MAG: TetR/AcrR family transcriptional regulator [Mesorhizobium sp.]